MVTQVSEERAPERMPGNVKGALVGVWFQVLSNGFLGFILMSETDNRLDHGQEVEYLGPTRAMSYASVAVAVVLIVCGILAMKRFGWVRIVVLAIEWLTLLSILMAFFITGTPSVAVGLFIPGAVASALLSERGREWFSR